MNIIVWKNVFLTQGIPKWLKQDYKIGYTDLATKKFCLGLNKISPMWQVAYNIVYESYQVE